MADLHSWQPSHWLIIREGENTEERGENKGEVEDERRQGFGDRGEEAIEL